MRTILIGSLAVVLAAAAGTILAIVLRTPPPTPAGLSMVLSSVDASIAGGYLTAARDRLASLRRLPLGEGDQMRVLKRCLDVGQGTGDYSLLASLSLEALSSHSRSPRLRLVAAYACLRSGRLGEAERILSGPRTGGEVADSLRGEVRLRRGKAWAGSDPLTRLVLALASSRDPSAFRTAARHVNDPRLALDGALLAAQQGMLQGAASIVRDDLEGERFDLPAGLLLYDAGAFTEAQLRLHRWKSAHAQEASTGLVLADIAEALGDPLRSREWLLQSLPLGPQLSWTPYADLALFSLQAGDEEAALRRVQDGLAFFPDSRELAVMKARVLSRQGDAAAAAAILQGVLAHRPSDSEAALLLLTIQGPDLSPEAARARLWRLFDRVPADPRVFSALAETLVDAQDWGGLRLAAHQHEEAGGAEDARTLLYRGVAAAMGGDAVSAIEAFRRSDELARDGVARFDIALVQLRRGGARAAREELDAAQAESQERLPPGGRPGFLSRVETLRGAAMMLDGDRFGAASALSRARSLDPHNLRAALLEQKLEVGGP